MILGVGLAVLAFAVVYVITSKSVGSSPAAAVATPAPMISIAVAKTDLDPYTILDPSNVAMLDVDASTAVSPTTRDANVLYGKMSRLNLVKGQPIQINQLTDTGFSNVIEKGKRAYTLPVSERSTFGGTLTENDYIDLLWTHKFDVTQFIIVPGADGKPQEKNKELMTTKTLLENIQVLRVISLRPPAPPPASGSSGSSGSSNAQAADSEQASAKRQSPASAPSNYTVDAQPQAILVLAVTDQQAEVLKFAYENGVVDLALRSSAPLKGTDGKTTKGPDGKDVVGDHDPEKTTGITDKVLVEQYGLLVPEILIK